MLVGLARVVVFCTVGRNASAGAGKNKEQQLGDSLDSCFWHSHTGPFRCTSTSTNLVCVGVSDFLDNVVSTTYLRESCGLEDLLFLSPSLPLLFRAPTPHFALVPVGTPPHKTNELHQNRSFRIYQFPGKSGSLLINNRYSRILVRS